MALMAQIIIWLVGIGVAIYLAVFEMFIGGWVDVVTSTIAMLKESITSGLVKELFWGIGKIIFASITAWFILMATALVSSVVGEYLD